MKRFPLSTTIAVLAALAIVSPGFAASASDDQAVTLNINEVAEITAGADITMTIVGTGTPGDQPADPTDSTSHLQYTSIVDTGTRKVQAKLAAANVPAGTSLLLTASNLAVGEGTSAGQVVLSVTDQDLITTIGSIATGSGAADGPQLDYVWRIDDMTQLDFGNDATVTVTFTLTAEA